MFARPPEDHVLFDHNAARSDDSEAGLVSPPPHPHLHPGAEEQSGGRGELKGVSRSRVAAVEAAAVHLHWRLLPTITDFICSFFFLKCAYLHLLVLLFFFPELSSA